MLDAQFLLRAAELGGGAFLALQLIGEVRCEIEQVVALLDTALDESEAAVSLDDPRRLRARQIGRVVRDVVAANAQALGLVEDALVRRELEPLLPLFEPVPRAAGTC